MPQRLRSTLRRSSKLFTNGSIVALAILAIGCAASADEDGGESLTEKISDAVTPAPTATVSSGTVVTVRLDDRLDSGQTQAGETFTMTVARPVVVGDDVAIPEGAVIYGSVTAVEPAGRPQKSGRMELTTERIEVRGESIPLSATIRFEGEGSLKEDLEEIGIAGGIGAALGAVIDGGKGAVIGGIAGAGGTFLATKGEQVELEPGTELVVDVNDPLEVPLAR